MKCPNVWPVQYMISHSVLIVLRRMAVMCSYLRTSLDQLYICVIIFKMK